MQLWREDVSQPEHVSGTHADRAGGERDQRTSASERERSKRLKHKRLMRERGGACSLAKVGGAFDVFPYNCLFNFYELVL